MHPVKQNTVNLESALTFFQSGDIDAAQKLLKLITCKKKAPALSWFLSGIISSQKSESSCAISAFKKTLLIQPIYPEAHNNLGVVFESKGNHQDAIRHYKKAIEQKPDYANALYNLANVNHKHKNLDAAEIFYKRAITIDSRYLKAINNLGLLYQQKKELDLANKYFKKAMEIDPNDYEVCSNFGQLRYLEGNTKEALSLYQKSLSLQPLSPEVHNNIGIALQSIQSYEDAEFHFIRAVRLRNNYPVALTNLADLYKETGKIELAKDKYKEALQLNPHYPQANNNFGLVEFRSGKYDSAKKLFEKALIGDDDYREARYNLSSNQLMSGQFTKGWENYLSRPNKKHPLAINPKNINLSELSNKHILLLGDQGIGDEIFFLRFSKQLSDMGNSITYLAHPKIKSLLSHIPYLPSIITDEREAEKYDLAISIGDLPSLLVREDTNIPLSMTLNYNKEYIKKIGNQLTSLGPPPYIGVSWRGGQKVKNFLFKEIPIAELFESLKNVKATFISLQRLPSVTEMNEIKQYKPFSNIADFSHYNDDLPKMLVLLSLLDEYIGVSNTNMHLRASLSKSAKVLVPHPPEWRWMLSGNTSPWFPEFSIYRQDPNNEWSATLKTLSQTLLSAYGRSN